MANINVSVATSNVSVTEIVSNVIITDPDNVIIGNVTTSQSVVSVSTSPSVVTVGTGPIPTPVTNAEIRAGVSASAPILYNESTGVFSLDSNASFISKTTDNLSEGSTNLYFTTARARQSISATGDISYDANTGVISYTGTAGDITDVVAGAGLTGGGSSGNVTLNVGAGNGITVNADNIAVNMSVFTTTDLAEGANLYYTTGRANTAIDTRVNKAYVEGLGVSYTSLTDKPTIPTHTSNLVNDSGFITSATANVISVNGETGVVVLDTGDIAEGANLYYTTTRANTAIDARVNKAFVDALGVEYSSLANAPTNVSFFTNDAGYLVAANLTSLTANVDSVNGQTGVVSLDTDDIPEGTANLYYSNARVNAFIQNNITTTDIDEGTNLYFTAARARGNISAAENITYNSTTGVIGLANSLANVSTITAQSGQNLTFNTVNALITKQKYSNVDVFSGNISSDGYAFFNSNLYNGQTDYFNYSGTTGIKNFIINTGNATLGSNAITGVSLINFNADAAESLSNLKVNAFFSRNEADFLPFPVGTRVVSVDAANSIVYMSANAVASANLAFNPNNLDVYEFNSALHDNQTGLTVVMISAADIGAGSNTTLFAQRIYPPSCYGYPATGPVISDFDVATDGLVTDYSLGAVSLASFFIGRNKISSPKSVFQAPRGLIVGESADLTNRAENDSLPSFGVNVLWNGRSPVSDYGGNTPLTQVLVKNYTTNNLQATNRTNAGPRIFFTAAEGDASQPILTTYPRRNLELGRISWWSTSSTQASLSSLGPPAYISAVTGQDCVDTNSGVGMYFGISPNTANFDRSLFMASSLGNTLIASAADSTGTHRPIIFAPSHRGVSQGNAALLYNQTILGNDTITDTVQTSGAHFAQINYNNDTALTGSRMAVTNGNNTNSSREGNVVLSIDRNYNSGNANVRVRTGGTNYYGSNNPDRVRFTFAPAGLVDGTAVTIRNFTNATVAAALNGNVFYVKRNDTGGYIGFELYSDSGLTTPVNLGVTNVNAGAGTFEYTRNNGVTAKDWSFVLPQSSNSLILTEDGINRITFSDANITTAGNITAGNAIVNGVSFNTAGTTSPSSGQIVYNSNYGTHQVGLNGSNVMLMGQDLVVYARNDEANTLLKGEVVFLSGASGDKATIRRAVNNSDDNSATTIGIVKSDIATGQLGYVVSQGVVDGLNLGAYTAGDKLYLGNVAGTFTNIKPQSPEHYVFIGVVERANAGNGQVLVRVQNGFELNEIHDIKLTSVQQNDILIRNSGNTLWVNQNFGTTVTNSNITLKQYQETRVNLGSTGGNITLNMANGSIFAMTATSSISNIALSNAGVGASGTLIITQDGTGGKTLTTTSAWKFASGSKTLSTAAGAIDIISFFTDGTTVYAALSKGYS